MNTSAVRATLAISVVGVFIFLTAFLALFPLLTSQQVQLPAYADFFTKIASVYSGIVGVIVGYYFARATGKGPSDSTVTGGTQP